MLIPADTGHQTGSSTQDGLQLPGDTIADTDEDGVAVVDSTVYKGMDKCMGSIKRQ